MTDSVKINFKNDPSYSCFMLKYTLVHILSGWDLVTYMTTFKQWRDEDWCISGWFIKRSRILLLSVILSVCGCFINNYKQGKNAFSITPPSNFLHINGILIIDALRSISPPRANSLAQCLKGHCFDIKWHNQFKES